jgi:hypothetical protein
MPIDVTRQAKIQTEFVIHSITSRRIIERYQHGKENFEKKKLRH